MPTSSWCIQFAPGSIQSAEFRWQISPSCKLILRYRLLLLHTIYSDLRTQGSCYFTKNYLQIHIRVPYNITNQLTLYHEVSCQNFCNNFTDWMRRQSSLIDEQNIKYSAWLTMSDQDSRLHSGQKYFTRENPHHEWLCPDFSCNLETIFIILFTFHIHCRPLC